MEERPATPFWLPDTSPLSLSEPSSSGPAFVVGPLGWRVALLVAYALSFTTTIVLSLRAFRRQYSALHSISWNRAFLVMSLIAMFCLPHNTLIHPSGTCTGLSRLMHSEDDAVVAAGRGTGDGLVAAKLSAVPH